MRHDGLIAIFAFLALGSSALSSAAASGPDAWDVVGVSPDDALIMHAEGSARSRAVGRIPHSAKGLRNLGCSGLPSFAQWQRMTPSERARSGRARWCRVEYLGVRGWVAGRFLSEGSIRETGTATRSIGPWQISCANAICSIEQLGLGSSRQTLFRVEPREGRNGQIIIERASWPSSGTLSIFMDGETISAGPIAPIRSKDRKRLVMTPDDITGGLLRQMGKHKTMVLSFPGEERGVEIHLEQFEEARRELELMRVGAAR